MIEANGWVVVVNRELAKGRLQKRKSQDLGLKSLGFREADRSKVIEERRFEVRSQIRFYVYVTGPVRGFFSQFVELIFVVPGRTRSASKLEAHQNIVHHILKDYS